ncbi:trimeric intracellular cation channel family protein [Rhizorhapis sp. SPR117]|uniref:trimeric intracellular cation channel family protein n=1 Tax=Rhizorhapis sp. SPR117 TaxID=2912611 RepID=UPI0030C8AFCF
MDLLTENLVAWLNIAGISVFAASGALAAARKRLDFIAAWFFALITAIGGGTLRDLLIGAPVFWMLDPTPVILCAAVAVLAWAVPCAGGPIAHLNGWMLPDWQPIRSMGRERHCNMEYLQSPRSPQA